MGVVIPSRVVAILPVLFVQLHPLTIKFVLNEERLMIHQLDYLKRGRERERGRERKEGREGGRERKGGREGEKGREGERKRIET